MWSRGPSKFKTFKLLQFLDDGAGPPHAHLLEELDRGPQRPGERLRPLAGEQSRALLRDARRPLQDVVEGVVALAVQRVDVRLALD